MHFGMLGVIDSMSVVRKSGNVFGNKDTYSNVCSYSALVRTFFLFRSVHGHNAGRFNKCFGKASVQTKQELIFAFCQKLIISFSVKH